MSSVQADTPANWNAWDRFWFLPASVARVARLRAVFCVLAIMYFVSAWGDAGYWFADGGPLSNQRVATFLRSAGLEDAANWIISPLFLVKSSWLYHAYLVFGVLLAVAAAMGRGGRLVPWMLWIVFVGWANRAMILSGLAETLLSLGLFAVAIAPQSNYKWPMAATQGAPAHWLARFAERLLAAQATVIFVATFVTMLAGRVWFNGLGAFALAAPAQDRTWDLTQSVLASPGIHEGLTHLLVMLIPIGMTLAWFPETNRVGKVLLCLWCAVVAILGSLWLYGLTLAAMVMAIQPIEARIGRGDEKAVS